jgi:uncharacterized phage protein (TIGR02220 family)
MAKRFTSTEKWTDPWFRRLSPKLKALWDFFYCNCDNAGVWKIDWEYASFCIGEKVSEQDLLEINDGKPRICTESGLLLILDYVTFQVGNLNKLKSEGKGLSNLQKSCIELINKYNDNSIFTGKLPVSYPYGTGIGIGIGKSIGKSKDKEECVLSTSDLITVNEIITDLNLVVGVNYRMTSSKTKSLIKARLNDGFTVDDFKSVHRKKQAEWGNDPKMSKFLRPETLYSNKFEGYLNQLERTEVQPIKPKFVRNDVFY